MIFIRFGNKGASVTFSEGLRKHSNGDIFILTKTSTDFKGTDTLFLDKSSIIKFLNSFIKIVLFLRKTEDIAVILMPSPFDWICLFKKGGIKTIKSIVHDHKTHQGDTNWKEFLAQSFWRIMKPGVITLSEYVADNLRKSDIDPVFTLFHPYFIEDIQIIEWSKRKFDIGIFGRFKSYQGIDNLEWIRRLLNEYELKVVYCGGSRKIFEDTKIGEEFIYGKISDSVFFNTMANTRFVLLPYVEATQSGIIPNAQALGCKIITTNVGGIPEQDIYNEFKIIELNYASFDNLVKSLDNFSVNEDLKYYPDSISPRKFIEKLKGNLSA